MAWLEFTPMSTLSHGATSVVTLERGDRRWPGTWVLTLRIFCSFVFLLLYLWGSSKDSLGTNSHEKLLNEYEPHLWAPGLTHSSVESISTARHTFTYVHIFCSFFLFSQTVCLPTPYPVIVPGRFSHHHGVLLTPANATSPRGCKQNGNSLHRFYCQVKKVEGVRHSVMTGLRRCPGVVANLRRGGKEHTQTHTHNTQRSRSRTVESARQSSCLWEVPSSQGLVCTFGGQ